jgi:hypothetical protein
MEPINNRQKPQKMLMQLCRSRHQHLCCVILCGHRCSSLTVHERHQNRRQSAHDAVAFPKRIARLITLQTVTRMLIHLTTVGNHR